MILIINYILITYDIKYSYIITMSEKLAFNIGGDIFLVDDINLDNFDLNNAQLYQDLIKKHYRTQNGNLYRLTDADYEMIVREVDAFAHNPLIKNDDLYFTFIFSLFKKGICKPRFNQMDINIINRAVILYNYAINKWKYIYGLQPTQINLELAKREINAVFAFLDAELNK